MPLKDKDLIFFKIQTCKYPLLNKLNAIIDLKRPYFCAPLHFNVWPLYTACALQKG